MQKQKPTAQENVTNTGYGTAYEIELTIPKEMAVTAFTVFDLGNYNCSGKMAWGLKESLRQDGPMVDVDVRYNTSAYKTHILSRIEDRPLYLSPEQEDQMDELRDLIESL